MASHRRRRRFTPAILLLLLFKPILPNDPSDPAGARGPQARRQGAGPGPSTRRRSRPVSGPRPRIPQAAPDRRRQANQSPSKELTFPLLHRLQSPGPRGSRILCGSSIWNRVAY